VSDDLKVGTSAVENPGQVLRVPGNRFALTGVRLSLSNLGCLRHFPMVEHVTTLAGVHAVLPPHRYTQAELTAAFTEICLGPDGDQALLARLHANAQVSVRHLVLPLSTGDASAGSQSRQLPRSTSRSTPISLWAGSPSQTSNWLQSAER
jgi:hypothetical protein